MRSCSGALALVLAGGGVQLSIAELFTVALQDGTTYRWTSFDHDLSYGGNSFTSQAPLIERTRWNVSNTMEVPVMDVVLRSLNTAFAGGDNIKKQIHNGLFDGATVLLERAYMKSLFDTAELGAIALFAGQVAGAEVDGASVRLKVKGLSNKLDVNTPRNLYQTGCAHTLFDAGCTLLKASLTTGYTLGGAPTKTFLPWASAPGTPSRYRLGMARITSGPAAGQQRTVRDADGAGLTLAYPLLAAPAAGNTFDATEGCDKTFSRCTALANTQHFRGFEFIPPAETAY